MKREPHRTTNGRTGAKRRAAGITAGLIGGAAGLLLLAPSLPSVAAPPTTEPVGEADADDAGDESTSDDADETTRQRGDRIRDVLQALVDDETLTAEQVEAIVDELQRAAGPGIWMEGPTIHVGPWEPGGPGRHDRHGRHGGPWSPAVPSMPGPPWVVPGEPNIVVGSDGIEFSIGIGGGPFWSSAIDTIADAIGIDRDDVVDAVRDGSTIAEIAAANGVEPQAVIDAIVAEIEQRVTAWVNGDESPDAGDTASETATADTTPDTAPQDTSA